MASPPRASDAEWMFSRTVNAQLSFHPMPAGPLKALASLRMDLGKGRPGGEKWDLLFIPSGQQVLSTDCPHTWGDKGRSAGVGLPGWTSVVSILGEELHTACSAS